MKKIKLALYYLVVWNLPHSRFAKLSNDFRKRYLKNILAQYGGGEKAYFENRVYIGDGSNIKIGRNCQINEQTFFQSCSIGDNVLIAPETIVLSKSHAYDRFDIPIIDQGDMPDQPVTIKDNVWIGRRCIVLPGVTIGENTVIGAGSIVTKSIPANVIAVGNPCKVLKIRE
jgi:acetyltransferase-like isoleucine patch superfamily enzyme